MSTPTGFRQQIIHVETGWIDPDLDIGMLAAALPAAAQVFVSRGIDFCCFAPRTVRRACTDHFLDPADIVREICLAHRDTLDARMPENSPDAVVQQITARFFQPLGAKLRTIDTLFEKVICFHGPGPDNRRACLKAGLSALFARLWDQRSEKEQLWFPGVLSQDARSISISVQAMRRENRILKTLLHRLFSLHTTVFPSTAGCASVKALKVALDALFRDCLLEIRLEQQFLYAAPSHPSDISG